MAQKDPETGPSLELPSLFGRRKRRAEGAGNTTTVPARAPEAATETATATAPESLPDTSPPPEAPDHTAVIPVVEQPVVEQPVVEQPVVQEPVAQESPAATTVTPPAAPAVTPTPVPVSPAEQPGTSRSGASTDDSPQGAGATAASSDGVGGRRKAERSAPSVPEMAASTAAFAVGALVGLLGCVLTYLGLQGCELVTGTGSCGGPGLLVLVVILVVMVIAGAVALKRLGVPEAGNVSFLGVGVMTVVALLFLIDYLYDPWMFLVVPAVTAVGFLLAQWVTTLYSDDIMGDEDDDGRPHVDIR